MGDSMGDSMEQAEMRPSRRAALKAGIGAGVGLAAWSGPTITSLGGTPAYAAGCTFVVEIDLSGGCRNTDQGNCASGFPLYSYHTLKDTGLPTGFALINNVGEGTCCTEEHTVTLTWPEEEGLTCGATIRLARPPNCTGAVADEIHIPPSSDGSLEITLSCLNMSHQNNQYTIVARCTTTGAPEECFTS